MRKRLMPKIKNPRYYLIVNKRERIFGAFEPTKTGREKALSYLQEIQPEIKEKLKIIKK